MRPLRFSIFARRFPIKIFEFSREKVGVIKTYGGSYFLDIGLLITADHLTGAFHAHLVDVPVSYTHLDVYKRQAPDIAQGKSGVSDIFSHIL